MKTIISVINDVIREGGAECLPCDKVNLDYERLSEYRDSDEHQAKDLFEYPAPTRKTISTLNIDAKIPSILRYFLDGSRRTYKIADLRVRGRYLPLIAGQVGVAILCRNENTLTVKPLREFCIIENVLSFPDEVTNQEDIAFLSQRITDETGHAFKMLRYSVKDERDPVDLGVAKIMSHMAFLELKAVQELSDKRLLQSNSILIKDGPLRYKNIEGRGFDITQFRNVVGLSKTFRPSFALGTGRGKTDVGVVTSSLGMGERTPVFKTLEEDKFIGMWYLRIRPRERMSNPLQGIVKMECYAIDKDEEERGLDNERINGISAHILRERNVSPYGKDSRWATHIYPIYQAETFIKSSLLSDIHFEAIF